MVAPAFSSPKFKPGQLVRHRRYGYRGVVVEFDLTCKASDEWYWRNQTQPPKTQPWYHVLVHGRQTNTYAAETSLEVDPSDEPIDHPLVVAFFSEFVAGRYIRNGRRGPTE